MVVSMPDNLTQFNIKVHEEVIEGQSLFVARIDQFPDVEEYADTYEEALELANSTIKTYNELLKEVKEKQ